MQPALIGPAPYDDLAYWLLRLSEALHRLNNGLLWAGASPDELDSILSGTELKGSDLAIDVAHASTCMRRFADLMFEASPARGDARGSIWEELMLALRLLLAACGADSELWAAGFDPDAVDRELIGELRGCVHAIERLCGHFERVH